MAERKGPDDTSSARVSIGPDALKAFAHPLRMSMYSELQRLGAATASQLGRALGESSGQTSYHLRQLERHGFVEDDPAHTGGRERWWRAVGFDMSSPDLLRDPGTAMSARAVLYQVVSERTGALSSWVANLDPDDDVEWAGMLAASTVPMTLEEMQALSEDLAATLERHTAPLRDRKNHELLPGVRRVRVHADVFPLLGPSVDPPDAQD